MVRSKAEEVEAAHGSKMIEVRVRFWTNDIAEKEGKVVPGECWDQGVVRLAPNRAHKIQTANPVPFNSMPDLMVKLENLLVSNGIRMHHGNKSSKLYRTD